MERHNGEYRWILETGVPRFKAGKTFAGYIGSAVDVTERKRAKELEVGQRKFLEMVATGKPIPEILDLLTQVIEEQSGEAFCSVMLLDEHKQNLRLGSASRLPESYRREIDGIAVGRGNGSCAMAAFRRRPVVVSNIANNPLWANIKDLPLTHGLQACASVPILANGHVLGTCAMYYREARRPSRHDMKLMLMVSQLLGIAIEHRRAEETLQHAELKYRDIFENAVEGIFQATPDGRFIAANPAMARMLGYESPLELITHRVDIERQQYVEPERRAEFQRLIQEQGIVEGFELQVYRKDGSKIWTSENVRLVCDENGTPLHYEGTVENITERKRAEEGRAWMAAIVESSDDAIIGQTSDGTIVSWNSGAERIYGYSPDEVRGRSISRLVPPDSSDELHRLYEKVRYGESIHHYETVRVRKDGELMNVSLTISPVRDGAGIIVGISTIARDITERKRAEEVQSRLMLRVVTAQEEEQRRLSLELHDHMAQSLTAMMLGLKSLEKHCVTEASAKHLDELQHLATQLAQEVRTLATQLRPPALDDLGLHTALSNYAQEWSKRSRIRSDFHCNGLINQRLPAIIETTVYRIVQEALTNVLKHAQAKTVSIIVEYRGNRVRAIVEDDGCGFEADAMMSVPARERRLGLLGMQERAALVGGTLNIESRPGAGTTLLLQIAAR
jgi:two-component system sensor histidine kinase UhpB